MEWLFNMLGAGMLISGVMVITAPNPGYSVFWLITVFTSGVGLFVLLEVEYIGLIYLIVYVGAIAIFFLFVIMMLKLTDIGRGGYQLVGFILGVVFFFEVVVLGDLGLFGGHWMSRNVTECVGVSLMKGERREDWGNVERSSNIESLGGVVYTEHSVVFILVSYILLVGMLGAIVLTDMLKQEVKRQESFIQVSRELWRG